ncbi:hypothetical protein AMATHDRAFT_64383 [Amanita thiersii Skay4041]|uniref:CsbD-like domain-containing protein n=1 Tax=Amanita thiersii Skay4041 TaxID=703135 RepID=A0A2A9NKM7_9AGAR|nr:hypothetical protein AMATHDRAFT_64383 [Amanita thiersii Skay4041]
MKGVTKEALGKVTGSTTMKEHGMEERAGGQTQRAATRGQATQARQDFAPEHTERSAARGAATQADAPGSAGAGIVGNEPNVYPATDDGPHQRRYGGLGQRSSGQWQGGESMDQARPL